MRRQRNASRVSRLLVSLLLVVFGAAAGAATLFDGDDGATCDYFNLGARILWRHRQGDWRDANDTEQGVLPFAVAQVKAADAGRTIAWDVTNLAQGWLRGTYPNDGLLITGLKQPNPGVAVFHSREAEYPDLRPRLSVTLSDRTTRQLAPIADTTLDCSTVQSIGGRNTISASTERMLLMQFDLAVLRGLSVSNAKLELKTTERQFGDSSLGVFRLDPPGPSAFEEKPRLGLAAAYPRDQGIEADRDAIMATGFESAFWPKDWSYLSVGSHGERVNSTGDFGFKPLHRHALQVRIPAGGNLGLDLSYKFADKLGSEPEEIYFRYYLRLGADWNPTTEGGKLPGISATYGKAGWGGAEDRWYQRLVDARWVLPDSRRLQPIS